MSAELEREVQAAAAWLRSEAEKTAFGSVGFTLVLHAGRVARIERTLVTRTATDTGAQYGQPRH